MTRRTASRLGEIEASPESASWASCGHGPLARDCSLVAEGSSGAIGRQTQTVAFLLADLGVTKMHSRPHVSNDNPFSEAEVAQ